MKTAYRCRKYYTKQDKVVKGSHVKHVQPIFCFVFGVIGALMAIDNIYGTPEGLDRLLPETVHGWKARLPDREYTSDTLFDLIDGGAEAYRALNVRRVLDRTYTREGAADIIIDLFDMGSSRDAFGAFHLDMREDESVGIGQESEYQGGSLFFWKDRYFVSIVALEETPQTRQVVSALGKRIAEAIPQAGGIPDIVKLLPSKGLQKEHIYYFHDLESLKHRYSIGEGNPLHLSTETEGLLARYRVTDMAAANREDSFAVFLIVSYPAASSVVIAQQDLSAFYLSKARPGTIVQLSNKRWAGSCSADKHLFAVLEAPDMAAATRLLDSVPCKEEK